MANALASTPVTAPIGSIVAWAGPLNTLPKGWRVCNGDSLDRTLPDNRALFDAIGTTWGGDGANLFRLPDLQGLFLRGVSAASGRDPDVNERRPAAPGSANAGNQGNAVGSMQSDCFQNHTHSTDMNGRNDWPNSGGNPTPVVSPEINGGDPRRRTGGADASAGSETRPKNAYVFWIIRWQ